ncbi:MIP/aquaporin family protein [Mycoplasmopsis cynos]|uniref:Aquaglyceroporin n=2 Tax=Mycoplasmopsis cynos TaxID=171284 RepID=A0A449AIM1_9BACT|nr:MIP/aquaporin family protein [Mycoplasmopsis cynos]MCU9935451.1 aquaporin family protein [Mycoplasmopsis cynos]UWV80338.1 aquaporin family protein [Mycoplasmopsis cynos]UWV86526.1 aquaporin family protein [Mycoplasmopsis cynos]WAM05826.1 aquaporin family protein [Mycoplasmopsis cynos]WAM08897.1 aquaporin family protein [Mycoplasmopsis cynos]
MVASLGLVYASELVGTLFLVLLGNGVVFSVSHKRMFANQPGKWVVIALGWGFAVLAGVVVGVAMGGPAHLNPAVTIFALVSDKFAHPEWLGFIVMQFIGAILAQIILDFINWKHIQETDLASVRGSHCTGPAFSNKEGGTIFNFSYELVGTLVLVGVILAVGKTNFQNITGIIVTMIVMSIGLSIGASTGYAINPARDLGPRMLYWFMEKTFLRSREKEHIGANFGYGWIPVIAPMVGGAIIGFFAWI